MPHQLLSGWPVTLLALWLSGILPHAAQADPPPIPAEEQPDVLTRGAVHEAFAEPIDLELQAGLVAPTQPPANIAEIPPTDRPDGDNFVWVPGYWSWDGDRNNYVWVSACWRVAPPDMSWVPGYWAAVDGGWEWIAGFWAPSGVQEIEYLPDPPPSDEVQPPGAPPSVDHIWVPPCHYWNQDQYVRRRGYWLAAQPGWVWAPSHYVRTPRGYVFCAGHWDYALEDRGILFAPVYFPPSVWGRAEYTYSPSIVVDLGGLSGNLFACPRYSHYYFGDYYDDAYVRNGIYPQFDGERLHTWYDPIYQHDRWQHSRTDPRWEETVRHNYDLRRADKDLRPARTYREMETRLAQVNEPKRKSLRLAQPLTAVVASKATSMKFQQINTGARQEIAKQATEVHKFREQRNQWETPAAKPKPAQLPAGHKDPVIPPAEHKDPVTPPAGHKDPVAPPAEHKDPAMPPAEHKDPVTPPVEHKDPVTPPAGHKDPVTPPAEHKDPVTPPAEHKDPVTPPAEHKDPVAPPAERKQPAARPERVKIPAPPVAGKPAVPGAGGKGPPARPADENKAPTDVKDTRKDQAENKGN